MKKILIIAIAISALQLLSCSGNDFPASDPSIIPAKSSAPAAIINSADSIAAGINIPAKGTEQIVMDPQSLPTSASPANTTNGAGLNPAHGQPGHRCDIAVGAPLNSLSADVNAKPVVQTVANPAGKVLTEPEPANNGSANPTAKLNPPHGQPGHDCSVQVGAPLKN